MSREDMRKRMVSIRKDNRRGCYVRFERARFGDKWKFVGSYQTEGEATRASSYYAVETQRPEQRKNSLSKATLCHLRSVLRSGGDWRGYLWESRLLTTLAELTRTPKDELTADGLRVYVEDKLTEALEAECLTA
jgi:hypothetical protein